MAGVYVVCDGSTVYYVGQSTDLFNRFSGHRFEVTPEGVRTKDGFLRGFRLKYRVARKYGEWLMAEVRLIRRLKPLANKQMIKSAQIEQSWESRQRRIDEAMGRIIQHEQAA